MGAERILIYVELGDDEARGFAQFLTRTRLDVYQGVAQAEFTPIP